MLASSVTLHSCLDTHYHDKWKANLRQIRYLTSHVPDFADKYDILNTKQRAQIVSRVTLGKPERKFEA